MSYSIKRFTSISVWLQLDLGNDHDFWQHCNTKIETFQQTNISFLQQRRKRSKEVEVVLVVH